MKARRHLENSFKNVMDLYQDLEKRFAMDVGKDTIEGRQMIKTDDFMWQSDLIKLEIPWEKVSWQS